MLINNKANRHYLKKKKRNSLKGTSCRSYTIILAGKKKKKVKKGGTVTPFLPKTNSLGGAPRAVFKSVDLFFQALNVTCSYIGLFCCCDMVSIDVHWNCAQLHWSQEPCNLEGCASKITRLQGIQCLSCSSLPLTSKFGLSSWGNECCNGTRSNCFKIVTTFSEKKQRFILT